MEKDPGTFDDVSRSGRFEKVFDRVTVPVLLLGLVGVVSTAMVVVEAFHVAWHRSPLDIDIYMMGGAHLFGGRLYVVHFPSPALGFTYPPFAALLFGPLSLLPRQLAQLIWSEVNVAALGMLLALSLRAVRPMLPGRSLVLWSMALMTPAMWMEPVRLTFSFGQINLVLAVLILFDLTHEVRVGHRVVPRGVLTGLAAAVKLTPLIFVPFLFFARQARSATIVLLTFVGVAVVMTILVPGTSWSYWTKYLFDTGRVGPRYYLSNQSLAGALERLYHGPVPQAVGDGLTLLFAVGGVALAVWAFRSSSQLLGILVCVTTGMVVSPVTWEHHMVWIVPVLIWLCLGEDRPAGGRWWAAASALLFWKAPMLSLPHRGTEDLHWHGWQLVSGNAFFYAMVVFLIGMAVMLFMRRHAGARSRRSDLEGSRIRSAVAPVTPSR